MQKTIVVSVSEDKCLHPGKSWTARSPARGQEETILMERKLAVVAMAIAALSATLAFGQARLGGQSRQNGGGATHIAGKSGWDNLRLNQVQDAVVGMIIGRQSSMLNTLDFSTKGEERNEVIIACNLYLRGLMTKEQQQVFDNEVLEVKKYRPGGKWNKVFTCGTKVSSILKATAEQERKIAAVREKYSNLDQQVIQRNVNLATAEERKHAMAAGFAKNRAALDKEFRALLTPAQRTELDAYMGNYTRELRLAAQADPPKP
jgi:hypothetical protein